MVTIKRDERNKFLRKLRTVEKFLSGKDGVVLPVRLKAGNSHSKSAVQYLHSSQLQCDRKITVWNDDTRQMQHVI